MAVLICRPGYHALGVGEKQIDVNAVDEVHYLRFCGLGTNSVRNSGKTLEGPLLALSKMMLATEIVFQDREIRFYKMHTIYLFAPLPKFQHVIKETVCQNALSLSKGS